MSLILEGATFIDNYDRVLGPGDPSGSQYAYYCPFPGCEGYRKKKFLVNPENGAWQCKHCCYAVPGKKYPARAKEPHGGGWREFAILMEDDLNRWPVGRCANPNKSNPLDLDVAAAIWADLFAWGELLERERQLVQARGIDPDELGCITMTGELWSDLLRKHGDEQMLRAGLAYRNQEEALRPTRCAQEGRTLIPYWVEGEPGRLRYFVGYAACPAQRPGESYEEYLFTKDRWHKVCGPAGYSTQIYGDVPEKSGYCILTEGQWKRAAAHQRGFPILGKSGMGSACRELATYLKKKKVCRVVMLYDTQLPDEGETFDPMELVRYEAERQARELLCRGIWVYHAELPLEAGERKADVDSYLLRHTNAEFAEIVMAAGRRPYRLIYRHPEGEPQAEVAADAAAEAEEAAAPAADPGTPEPDVPAEDEAETEEEDTDFSLAFE